MFSSLPAPVPDYSDAEILIIRAAAQRQAENDVPPATGQNIRMQLLQRAANRRVAEAEQARKAAAAAALGKQQAANRRAANARNAAAAEAERLRQEAAAQAAAQAERLRLVGEAQDTIREYNAAVAQAATVGLEVTDDEGHAMTDLLRATGDPNTDITPAMIQAVTGAVARLRREIPAAARVALAAAAAASLTAGEAFINAANRLQRPGTLAPTTILQAKHAMDVAIGHDAQLRKRRNIDGNPLDRTQEQIMARYDAHLQNTQDLYAEYQQAEAARVAAEAVSRAPGGGYRRRRTVKRALKTRSKRVKSKHQTRSKRVKGRRTTR